MVCFNMMCATGSWGEQTEDGFEALGGKLLRSGVVSRQSVNNWKLTQVITVCYCA